jgi:hypothetical protein
MNTGGLFGVFKVATAGTETQLGSSFQMSLSQYLQDKLDVYFDNAASGNVKIYLNGVLYFNYSGDTRTETTSMAHVRLGNNATAVNSQMHWSEIMVLDHDTRTCSLQPLIPAANGNTHDFDVGTPAAANINEISVSDSTVDGATTNGMIDQYTINAIAAGTYTILALGITARAAKGDTGPANLQLGVRITATDYWDSSQALTVAWEAYQKWWTVSPATSATWAALPVNIGVKAVT